MKPYVPSSLPLQELDAAKLLGLVGAANAAIARYDGLLQTVINPTVMLAPLTNREAVLSSKIEGTQATVDEVLEFEAGMEFDADKERDIQEIVNYRKTLSLASEVIRDTPISLSLLRQMHSILMDSVRGQDKSPGQFRLDQNWSYSTLQRGERFYSYPSQGCVLRILEPVVYRETARAIHKRNCVY